MSDLGIAVSRLTITFHSGQVGEWSDIRLLREATGLTLLLGPHTVQCIPWSAIETAKWTLAPPEAPSHEAGEHPGAGRHT